MKKYSLTVAILVLVFSLFLSGCGAGQVYESRTTQPPTNTATQSPTPTPSPSPNPTTVPTVFGGYKADRLFIVDCEGNNICLSSIDGNTKINLTNGRFSNIENLYMFIKGWSLDGKWLQYFIGGDDCEKECGLWTAKVDGSEERQLIPSVGFSDWNDFANFNYGIDWSPDNSKFLFNIRNSKIGDPIENYEIGIINISDFSMHPTNHFGFDPQFSPDGKSYAYLSINLPYMNLYVVSEDRSEPFLVSSYFFSNPVNQGGNFLWEAGGNALLYSEGNQVYKINIDGTGKELIVDLDKRIDLDSGGPSPDGAYLSFRYGSHGNGAFQAGIIDIQNKKAIIIPKDGRLFWTPDNQLILLDLDTSEYFLTNPANGELTLIDVEDWFSDFIQP